MLQRVLLMCLLVLSSCAREPAASTAIGPIATVVEPFCTQTEHIRWCNCYALLDDGRAVRVIRIDDQGVVVRVRASHGGLRDHTIAHSATVLQVAGPEDPLYGHLRHQMEEQGGT